MDEEYFQHVLARVRDAYERSDIRYYCEQKQFEWFYSICATPLVTGRPVMVGFNWGAKRGELYRPQESCPADRFLDVYNKGWLGSMSRVVPYLTQHFGSDILESIGQMNYCFFRSTHEGEISERDLALCRPIFLELLGNIRPNRILCFSTRLRDYWNQSGMLLDVKTKAVLFSKSNGACSYEACVALLRDTDTKIYFLPHPNYAITKKARDEIWQFAFDRGLR